MGHVGFAESFEDCSDVRELRESWEHGINDFKGLREPFLMY